MDDYTDEQRQAVAQAVKHARGTKGWSKEEAARRAKISSITWKRVEDGLRVQDTKIRGIEAALGWKAGSVERVAEGEVPVYRQGDVIYGWSGAPTVVWSEMDDAPVWDGFKATTQFAHECKIRGASTELLEDFVANAAALLNQVLLHPGSSIGGPEVSDPSDRDVHLVAAHDEEGSISGGQEQPDTP